MQDYCYASINEIHKAYRKKNLSVKGFVLSLLARIVKVDKGPNGLNSVLEINPDALAIADTLDEILKNGGDMLPLFGIPVFLKDNVNTADRLHTSAGSVALADNFAPYDAHLVELLRKAGAIILGKVNMTEFANYMTREGMPNGYSSKGGQVFNPFNRERTTSGSSSGSAVAVAAGLCPISIGTETGGSVIAPAAHNGVVGIKPTLGLVGRSGIIPISSTLDSAGTMARNVRDAALMLGVISGADPDDAASCLSYSVDYTKELDKASIKGLRIGINRAKMPEETELPEEEKIAFKKLCDSLEGAGAILVDHVDIDRNPAISSIMRYEFKACLNHYLSTLRGSTRMKTLKDIIEYNQTHSSSALKFGQSLLIECENNTSGLLTEPEYIEALFEREKTIALLDSQFNKNDIQLLLCERFTNIAPFTGFPTMTIPYGQKRDKMPIASYWIARRWDEETLIKSVYAVEQILRFNLKPKLDSTISRSV